MDGLSHFAPRPEHMPQTPVMRQHIDHPSAWKVPDFRSSADYSLDLTPTQLADIEACVKAIRAAGLKLEDIEKEHFPLRTMADTIAAIRHEVTDGRGFVVLRQLPVEAFSKDEIGMIYWGIGTHLGIGLSQSVMGDRLGHVKDFSREDPNARAYRNKQELSPHTDLSDFVGLCCLRSARSGGVSRLASALTIHNIILAERPHYLDRLYRGYTWHRRGEERPSDPPVTPHLVPIFCNVEGKVSIRYVRSYIEAGMAEVGSPVDDFDREILDFIEATSKRPDVMLEFTLAPGEMYFLNNYTTLHARTSFDDFEDEDRRRHLLRLWLEVPSMRPVHPHIDLFEGKGIAAVAGRTPTYDWKKLTSTRG
jgi:hypothetical protein